MKGKNLALVVKTLNMELELLVEWLKYNTLSLNIKKNNLYAFSSSKEEKYQDEWDIHG